MSKSDVIEVSSFARLGCGSDGRAFGQKPPKAENELPRAGISRV
jgi:hypothetical protein